jgi:hypothetical protein
MSTTEEIEALVQAHMAGNYSADLLEAAGDLLPT